MSAKLRVLRCLLAISPALISGCTRCSSTGDESTAEKSSSGASESTQSTGTETQPTKEDAAPPPGDAPASSDGAAVDSATDPKPAGDTPAAAPRAAALQFSSTDIKVGKGPAAEAGKTVKIHYVGTLVDGFKFDSSVDRDSPLTFVMGNAPLKGWDKGITGMQVGGKRRLTVPAALGYGEKGVRGVVPPNSDLIFEIELLEVK